MSVNSKTPVLIVKDYKKRADRPDGFTYGVLIDGSNKAMQALNLLCRTTHDKDKIVAITCEQANIDAGKVRDQANKKLEEEGKLDNAEVVILKS